MAWLIILNSMVYSVICVNYQLNKTFISDFLCENKDVPLSQCKGQCFLGKQLDAAEEQAPAEIAFRADFNVFMLTESACFSGKPMPIGQALQDTHPLFPNYSADLATGKKPPEA